VGGVGNSLGAVVGAIMVVTFLESTRFITPLIPGLSAVQGAALREFLISVSLIVILRFRQQGLLPEARAHPVLPELSPQNRQAQPQ
jgi:branched-chain amino acid transport system permease protein